MTYPFRLPNYKHQQKEWDEHRDDPARALLWQMRTGKTKSVLDLACYLYTEGKIDGVLVFAPNGVHVNWVRRQLPPHMWTTVPYVAHAWQSSMAKTPEHAASLERCLTAGKDVLPVFTVNSESIIYDKVAALITKFIKKRRIMLVVDESHDFRSPGSKRTKRIRALSKRCVIKRILTGTSVSNSPLAAFSQFEILQPGALGHQRFAEFEHDFAHYIDARTKGGQTYKKLEGYRNLDELQKRMADWASVVLREDVDDMPNLILDERTIVLSEEHRNKYQKFVKEQILELENGSEAEAIEGGVVLIKLQQILSGFVVDTEAQVQDIVADKDNPRLLALLDEVSNTAGKVIIWCKYQEDLRRVSRALAEYEPKPIKAVQYHGQIHSQQKRQQAIDAFMTDPDVKCFVGQPKAGGSGLDLSIAEVIIWYSHTFDLIERDQANERATQIGGKSIIIRDFVVPGTVDEYILATLSSKRSVSDSLAGTGLRDRLLGVLRGQL